MKVSKELVLIELTWLPKKFYEYAVLTKFGWLTQENHFRLSDYWARSANKGFSCFGILSLMNLSISTIQLRRWIIIVLICIQADLTMYMI